MSNISEADVIIYNTFGKVVYKEKTNTGDIKFDNNNNLTPGIYLIKAISGDGKVYHTKLIIR